MWKRELFKSKMTKPSAGLKFGHDLQRMAHTKEIQAMKNCNELDENDARKVIQIFKKEWPLKVSIVSTATIERAKW